MVYSLNSIANYYLPEAYIKSVSKNLDILVKLSKPVSLSACKAL